MEIVIMQKMTFHTIGTRTVLNCIIEPLKDTDQVYVVTAEGKVLKWDNTVTETTTEYLEHFSEVSVNDCPVLNSCSNSEVSFIDIVEKEATKLNVKYESNSKNPFKTESYLLAHFVEHFVEHCDVFPNNWKKVTIHDDTHSIVDWIIDVDKSSAMHLIPDEYKDLQDNEVIKRVLESIVILSLKDDKVNKLITVAKAVKDYCDKLKAAKESKKLSDNKEEKQSDEA
jgi:hypothetical protein